MRERQPIRVRIIGMGMGPDHLTGAAASALRTADYIIAADKGGAATDPLLALRRSVAATFDLEVTAVPDPPRDRADPDDYPAAVAAWHRARVDAYASVLRERGGTAAFLVWGDPSLYDSTLRIAASIAEILPIEYDVIPGVSAPSLLAARHRIVLHRIGEGVHITTARRLHRDIADGHDNLVVLLGAQADLAGLDDWSIWWGANLGTDSEQLISGRVGDVTEAISAARERARSTAGWVMDIYLLRRH